MRKSATILTIAACVGLCALVWAQDAKSENVPIPAQVPAVSASLTAVEQSAPSVREVEEASEAYTPTPPVKVQESQGGNGLDQQKSTFVPPVRPEAPAPTTTPKPTEEVIPPKPPAPQEEPGTPKMGDTRTVDGQKQVYFLGFGWIEDNDEPNVGIYAEDMCENGNKVGSMSGGTVVDDEGCIDKMVGVMGE